MTRPSRRELEHALAKLGADASAASITEYVDALVTDGFDVGFGGGDAPAGVEVLVEGDGYSIHVDADQLPEWLDTDAVPVRT